MVTLTNVGLFPKLHHFLVANDLDAVLVATPVYALQLIFHVDYGVHPEIQKYM